MLSSDLIRVADAKAAAYRIPAGYFPAIIDVESGGRVYYVVDGQNRPAILFEPHLFGRRLTEGALTEALRLGLATKSQKKNKYPKSQKERWAQIAAAQALCQRHGLPDTIAFECASYGVGQVLGSHWKALGFADFSAFYDRMMSGAEGQIDIMLKYIVVNNMDDELRDGRWAGFFRGYNGPAYARLGYDRKIEAALIRYGAADLGALPDGMLRIGSRGARVRELQALLGRAGYPVKVDGDFGPATKKALKAFQRSKGIAFDGIYGPETEAALAAYRQGAKDAPGKQSAIEVKQVVEGAVVAGGGLGINQAKDAVEAASGQLQQYEGISPYIGYGLTALAILAAVLAIAGIGWALYGWLQSRKTVEA